MRIKLNDVIMILLAISLTFLLLRCSPSESATIGKMDLDYKVLKYEYTDFAMHALKVVMRKNNTIDSLQVLLDECKSGNRIASVGNRFSEIAKRSASSTGRFREQMKKDADDCGWVTSKVDKYINQLDSGKITLRDMKSYLLDIKILIEMKRLARDE